MALENEHELMELEAEHVFLLMKKEYRISRNTRALWYFNNLNKVVRVPKADKMEHFKGELEIISAVPQETPLEWDWDTSHLYKYLIGFCVDYHRLISKYFLGTSFPRRRWSLSSPTLIGWRSVWIWVRLQPLPLSILQMGVSF